MKLPLSAIILSALSIAANAQQCFTTVSHSETTRDKHCARKCKDHKGHQKTDTITMQMAPNFKEKKAIFRNVRLSCAGVGCGWYEGHGATAVGDGQTAQGTYLFWGRPITVTLTADVCELAAVYTPTPPPVPPPPPVTPVQPPGPSAPSDSSRPSKLHEISEAGGSLADCDRMKKNWLVDASNYCRPMNVNHQSINLQCTSSGSPTFTTVKGLFLCY